MKKVQSFHEYSKVCVPVGVDVIEWFPLNVGGCESVRYIE